MSGQKQKFANLSQEEKDKWFKKKGIEQKPKKEFNTGGFKSMSEEDKKKWMENKGLTYVSREEWIKQMNAKKEQEQDAIFELFGMNE